MAREQAALGADAAQFQGVVNTSATVQDYEDDLLGEDSIEGAQQGDTKISEFESSFPTVDTRNDVSRHPFLTCCGEMLIFNQQVGTGGTITGSDIPLSSTPQPSYAGFSQIEEDSEPIR